MKKIFQILRTHPWAIMSYILYILFCLMTIASTLRFEAALDRIQGGDKVAWGEGVMYGDLFAFVIATVFVIIIIFNALFRETGQSFYWWLCLFIVIPLIILVKVGSN
jgi:hypothetical protein